MKEEQDGVDRRNFLRTMGAAGLGSVLVGCKGKQEKEPDAVEPDAPTEGEKPGFSRVPRRKLGKTGLEVPCLSLGTAFNLVDSRALLRKTLQWGVNAWDTAYNYAGGNSELGIGEFISKNAEVRKELFIISKPPDVGAVVDVPDVERCLMTSLKRLNTRYIDLYHGVHGLSDPGQLTSELEQWAKDAKKRKLIRFFGFSTHKNMARVLAAASKLDWIDAITTSYNFRFMQDDKLQAAVDACHQAGIGLIAIKTQGHGQKIPWGRNKDAIETEEDKKLVEHFLQRGFTEAQAKIKVVLEDERFSSVCVGMENVAILASDVAAALDRIKLTQADREVLKEYARASRSSYCTGCSQTCSSAVPDAPYVSEIMRSLMYYNSYGQYDRAEHFFAQIPVNIRKRLLSVDYRLAEARCPQRMPIGRLVAEAVGKLA